MLPRAARLARKRKFLTWPGLNSRLPGRVKCGRTITGVTGGSTGASAAAWRGVAGSGFVNRRSRVQVSKSAPQKTCGFRDQRDPLLNQAWTGSEALRSLAELFLKACALGAPCGDLATALAAAVVDAAGVKLAVDVLAGGEHQIARATELAARVLDETRGETGSLEETRG